MKIGIDLGTTNSAVAYINQDGLPEIISNAEGSRITPSVILFEDDEVVIGEVAKQNSIYDPLNVVQFVKRQMGNKDFAFTTENGKTYSAEELSALLLKKLKQDAEAFLDAEITQAVVTVPAYFDDAKRQATKDAGKLIGLNIVKIINEPTAAALSFAHGHVEGESKILVYDLGGGTFDATLMIVTDSEIDILATCGDKNLGGFDFDNLIINHVIEAFEEQHDIDLFDDEEAMQSLRERAESVKQQLSFKPTAPLMIGSSGKKLKVVFTREMFEEMLEPLLERSIVLMDMVMEDGQMRYDELDSILLVGGSSRIPLIETLIENRTQLKPSRNINPDEAVAIGAAWQNEYLDTVESDSSNKKMIISDVSSHSIGLVSNNDDGKSTNTILLKRNSTLPIGFKREFFLIYDEQDRVDIQVTEGEDEDLDYVRIIGEAKVKLPPGIKAGDGLLIDISLDDNQIVHVYAFLSEGNVYLGEMHLERASNLSEEEIEEKGQAISNTTVN